jgi:hypothetical protein
MRSAAENFEEFRTTILSRFDCIFLIKDKRTEENDMVRRREEEGGGGRREGGGGRRREEEGGGGREWRMRSAAQTFGPPFCLDSILFL